MITLCSLQRVGFPTIKTNFPTEASKLAVERDGPADPKSQSGDQQTRCPIQKRQMAQGIRCRIQKRNQISDPENSRNYMVNVHIIWRANAQKPHSCCFLQTICRASPNANRKLRRDSKRYTRTLSHIGVQGAIYLDYNFNLSVSSFEIVEENFRPE